MSGILEFYRTRFSGQRDVRRQGGGGWNGPCPLCGGDAGKSDRFMIWPDRRESGSHKRGPICIEHDIPGIWWCRRCGEGGDSIAYLTKCEGMGFKDACAELASRSRPVSALGADPRPKSPCAAPGSRQPGNFRAISGRNTRASWLQKRIAISWV